MRRGSVQIKSSFMAVAVILFFSVSCMGYFLLVRSSDPFKAIEKLDIDSYSESAKIFQGGVFWFEGRMDEILKIKSGYGKLVSIAVSSSKGVNLIPLLIPESLNGFNLQKGQSLKFKVRGIEGGLLKVEKIEKAS